MPIAETASLFCETLVSDAAINNKVGFEFTKEYDKLLSITGKASLKDIRNSIGIDITKIEFWRESLNGIKDNIQKFIDLSKDKDVL